MKAKTEFDGQTIELDFGEVEKRLENKIKGYFDELKDWQEQKKTKEGKGVVQEAIGTNTTKLVEQLRNVAKNDITEQWSIVIPNLTQYEPAAHLRDYVFVTDVIKGNVGDVVEIPYVKDFEFEHPTVGSAFTGKTGLVATETTTLVEAGTYYDAAYEDIEKINQNLLDELNRTFAHAAVRAEDLELIYLLSTLSTGSFADDVGMTGTDLLAGSTVAFKVEWIPQAIGALIKAGKEVHPGDCVLAMGASAYACLLELLASTTATAVAYARGDVITKGMVEDWLGVRIVVLGISGWTTTYAQGSTYECAFLMRAKRALALAPKRDILIETDRIIKTRKLTITGSHTFGVQCLDPKEAVRILTGTVGPKSKPKS